MTAITLLGSRASAQNCNFLRVWVDPAWGVDIGSPDSIEQINDPDQPCRSLQFAIDKLLLNLSRSYAQDGPNEIPTWEWQPDLQGLVICLPGLYGPHGPYSSGDALPILMRDRVHVQGLSTQACVLRGGGTTPSVVFWPDTTLCQSATKEVLVDFLYAHPFSPYPSLSVPTSVLPSWCTDLPDTREMLDGFTFQGGDAQVVFRTGLGLGTAGTFPHREWPLTATISHCVFDMRHGWTASEQGVPNPYAVNGPTFGVMMIKSFLGDVQTPSTTAPCGGITGYYDQQVVLQNNTFVLGEWAGSTAWTHLSRVDAVAVIDVTDPGCAGSPCSFVDPNKTKRGLGSNALVNNLFRIPPYQISIPDARMAMLGIDASDVTVVAVTSPSTQLGDFNGYAPARVGSTNGVFTSVPVSPVVSAAGPLGSLLDCATPACTATTLPSSPVLRIWNGAANPNPPEYDPVFVGEIVKVHLSRPGYRDWRVMPGSPAIDRGYFAPTIAFQNGVTVTESACAELQTFDWDGEGYGNPRLINGSPDLGFDEFHMMIMTGSYSPDSFCHNKNDMTANPPTGHLHPSVGDSGFDVRFALIDPAFAGFPIEIYKTWSTPTVQPPGLPGWSKPPRTLPAPFVDASVAQPDYDTKYIAFLTTLRTGSLPSASPFQPPPPLQAQVSATWLKDAQQGGILDSECVPAPCTNSYFNTQALILLGAASADRRYGNLQFEYR